MSSLEGSTGPLRRERHPPNPYSWILLCVPLPQLGPYESTRVELPGLAAGRTYRFQVCAMELLGLGECSTWSSPVEVLTPRRR